MRCRTNAGKAFSQRDRRNAQTICQNHQFRSAMEQMTEADYVNLTEIGYDNGFADQSHFIRSFKRYTGKTPKEFLQHIQL
ncbi:MAG: helix-turn-helix domain-containing protein [Calditrichia bacterium]